MADAPTRVYGHACLFLVYVKSTFSCVLYSRLQTRVLLEGYDGDILYFPSLPHWPFAVVCRPATGIPMALFRRLSGGVGGLQIPISNPPSVLLNLERRLRAELARLGVEDVKVKVL